MEVLYKGAVVTGTPEEVARLLGVRQSMSKMFRAPDAGDPVIRPVMITPKRHYKRRCGKFKKVCEQCGKSFFAKHDRQRFCNCSCAGVYNAGKRNNKPQQ